MKHQGNVLSEKKYQLICCKISTMKKDMEINQTKLMLANACKECMRTTPVESITVKQICDKSNLSRQTFYRCFCDKYDLMNWYFDVLLNQSFDQLGSGKTVREGLNLKFKFIQQEYIFFRVAFSNDNKNSLKEHDFEMIFSFYQNLIHEKGGQLTEKMKDILEMYCSASIYMTVKWVMQAMPSSCEELCEIMIAAMPKELEKLFRELNILN